MFDDLVPGFMGLRYSMGGNHLILGWLGAGPSHLLPFI